MRTSVTATAAILAMALAHPAAATTLQQISDGFADGVSICLEATLKNAAIADLPADIRARVAPAGENARFMVAARNPNGPIWDVLSAKDHIVVSEAAKGDCEVITYGPPVQATIDEAMAAVKSHSPAFTASDDQPDDYTPIRAGLSATVDGAHIHAVFEGVEPGTVPARKFRFSLIQARFIRTSGQ